MPAQLETVAEKRHSSLKDKTVKIGATLMAAAAFSGLAAPRAKAGGGPSRKSEIARVHADLREPSELPGSNQAISAELLNEVKASTLEIVSRPKPQPGEIPRPWKWLTDCTAVKITIPGSSEPYLMTAAHCMDIITGAERGFMTDSLHPANKAENFTDAAPYEFAVLDPEDTNSGERFAQPIAMVDQISVSTDYIDTALLHAEPVDPSAITSQNIRQYDSIPAIPLKIAEQPPLQGTPVAMYGIPEDSGFEPVSGVGIYLGRITLPEASTFDGTSETADVTYDLVGVPASSALANNQCQPGSSGSMGILPNGELLGSQSLYTNNFSSPEYLTHPEYRKFDNYWRPVWEKELRVKLGGFPTICGFQVFTASTPTELLQGFEIPATFSKNSQEPAPAKP